MDELHVWPAAANSARPRLLKGPSQQILPRRVAMAPLRLPASSSSDEQRFRLDFLPFVERTVQPYGVSIDGIRYYGSSSGTF